MRTRKRAAEDDPRGFGVVFRIVLFPFFLFGVGQTRRKYNQVVDRTRECCWSERRQCQGAKNVSHNVEYLFLNLLLNTLNLLYKGQYIRVNIKILCEYQGQLISNFKIIWVKGSNPFNFRDSVQREGRHIYQVHQETYLLGAVGVVQCVKL